MRFATLAYGHEALAIGKDDDDNAVRLHGMLGRLVARRLIRSCAT
jgi:hypothetical protein